MNSNLSERELQVLDYAAQGHTDDMIAQALGIGKGTVNSYWVRIRGKMGHLSRTHLVANHIQAKAKAKPQVHQTANDLAANEQVEASRQELENERSRFQTELQEQKDIAEALAEKNKIVLEKAEIEIERLRKLLKDRDK